MAAICEEPTIIMPNQPMKKRKLDPTAMNEACGVSDSMGLIHKFLSLNVTHYTWILNKTLEKTDLNTCGSRLLLTSKKVAPSPLFRILTSTEHASVHEKTGLKVRSFDLFGREYNMVFKFLQSNGAYRIIGEWSRFLRQNSGMRVGDEIEIHAFRIPKGGVSEIGMALLHNEKHGELFQERYGEDEYRKIDVSPDEWIAAEGLVKLQNGDPLE